MTATLTIDIGGTKFSLAAFAGSTMVHRHSETNRGRANVDGTAVVGSRQGLAARAVLRPLRRRLRRAGRFPSQQVIFSTHVGGWRDYPLVPTLQHELRLPVFMDNDANLGALGEGFHGAGVGMNPLFYMTLSTGIGGGILVNGELVRGANSYGGEIGHMTIRPDGPQCLCGWYGCFERICCGLWLARDYGKPARELLQDPEFVARYVVDLALGLKACIMLLNPARIVIGGGISKAGDRLFDLLRAELRRTITWWSRARIDVVPAALGDDSVLYGALMLANQPAIASTPP